MKLLNNKVALITGSGRGIGAAAAVLFAEHGANVVVTDIDLDPAREVAAKIARMGGTAFAVEADVTSTEGRVKLIGEAVSTYGGIDILVNNAGYTWDGMAHKMSDEQWEAMLAVHLTAPYKIIRACAPYMREVAKKEIKQYGTARARKIINISSTTGTRGNVGQVNYAAGKAGIIGVTRTLAKEWAQFNIQVNVVAFGLIETRLTQVESDDNYVERGAEKIKLGIPEHIHQIATAIIPAGRPGTPEEAAGPLLFFASELSNYVSGQVLEVAGGV